eukprot:gene25300-biopygen20963
MHVRGIRGSAPRGTETHMKIEKKHPRTTRAPRPRGGAPKTGTKAAKTPVAGGILLIFVLMRTLPGWAASWTRPPPFLPAGTLGIAWGACNPRTPGRRWGGPRASGPPPPCLAERRSPPSGGGGQGGSPPPKPTVGSAGRGGVGKEWTGCGPRPGPAPHQARRSGLLVSMQFLKSFTAALFDRFVVGVAGQYLRWCCAFKWAMPRELKWSFGFTELGHPRRCIWPRVVMVLVAWLTTTCVCPWPPLLHLSPPLV